MEETTIGAEGRRLVASPRRVGELTLGGGL